MAFCDISGRAPRRFAVLLALVVMATALGVQAVQAQELLLSNLVLNNFEGRIRVRFGVEPTGLDRIRQSLEAGERLALRCRARLSSKRDYVWNLEVSAATWESELRRLKGGDFVATLPGHGSIADRELGSLFRKAWNEIMVDLGPWEGLERGSTYVLSLELSLARLDVSPWLKKGLFFWSFDAAPSVSYQLDFTY